MILDKLFKNEKGKFISIVDILTGNNDIKNYIYTLAEAHAIDLIDMIYPDLKGKLSYCGQPVMYDGILFVSIPHPSRISYSEMANCVNKITKVINNKS